MHAATQPAISVLMMLFSVLVPQKLWYAPTEPITVSVRPQGGPVTLVLTDFTNRAFEPKEPVIVTEERNIDVRTPQPVAPLA